MDIISVSRIEEHIVIVDWTAANVDVIESLQLKIMRDADSETYTFGNEHKKLTIWTTVEPGDYVTVTAFDSCGNNNSSEPSPLNVPVSESQSMSAILMEVSTRSLTPTEDFKSTGSLTSTSMFCPSPVVTPTIERRTGKDHFTFMSVLIPLQESTYS